MGAQPGFRVLDPSTIEISWPSELGKQYGISSSTDLESWTSLGAQYAGTGELLTVTDGIAGTPAMFYRIEEVGAMVHDLLRFKFATVGNRWTYNVVEDQGSGPSSFVWDTAIAPRTVFEGQDVVEWIFLDEGVWVQSVYILDDFTTGIWEAGLDNSSGERVVNTPAAPTLFAEFVPGVANPAAYTSATGLGLLEVMDEVTITVEDAPVTVPAGTWSGSIKVVHETESVFAGNISIFGTTTEWFALDVGLIKRTASSDVLGTMLTSSFELADYEVN